MGIFGRRLKISSPSLLMSKKTPDSGDALLVSEGNCSRSSRHRAQQDDGVVSNSSFFSTAFQIPDIQEVGCGRFCHQDSFLSLREEVHFSIVRSMKEGFKIGYLIRRHHIIGNSRIVDLIPCYRAMLGARGVKGAVSNAACIQHLCQIAGEGDFILNSTSGRRRERADQSGARFGGACHTTAALGQIDAIPQHDGFVGITESDDIRAARL